MAFRTYICGFHVFTVTSVLIYNAVQLVANLKAVLHGECVLMYYNCLFLCLDHMAISWPCGLNKETKHLEVHAAFLQPHNWQTWTAGDLTTEQLLVSHRKNWLLYLSLTHKTPYVTAVGVCCCKSMTAITISQTWITCVHSKYFFLWSMPFILLASGSSVQAV